MKYQSLTPRRVDEVATSRHIIDTISLRNLPRQIMILNAHDDTLFNYEYPVFPYCHGLYSGPERYAKDVIEVVQQRAEEGETVAEIYFLGTRLEYEKIVSSMRDLRASFAKEQPLECFYVKPDIETIRADMMLDATELMIDDNLRVIDETLAITEDSGFDFSDLDDE